MPNIDCTSEKIHLLSEKRKYFRTMERLICHRRLHFFRTLFLSSVCTNSVELFTIVSFVPRMGGQQNNARLHNSTSINNNNRTKGKRKRERERFHNLIKTKDLHTIIGSEFVVAAVCIFISSPFIHLIQLCLSVLLFCNVKLENGLTIRKHKFNYLNAGRTAK